MLIARRQTLLQLSDELLAALDSIGARDSRSRSELVREAIERYLAEDREADIDRQIVEAYARQPATREELAWAEAGAREMLSEESWDDVWAATHRGSR
jgi:metal-responsive CopG/Arc/MetJ family transcriptional regulator